MAFNYANRVKETSTTEGAGTFNLDGAPSSYQTFVAGIGNANTCFYCIAHQSANEWEVGIGTVTDGSPDTLARTTILASSNGGSAVSFSAGTKDVFNTIAAASNAIAGGGDLGTATRRFETIYVGGVQFSTNAFLSASGSSAIILGQGELLFPDTNPFRIEDSDKTISANQNDYDYGGGNALRISCDADGRRITGLQWGNAGLNLQIRNVGTKLLVLRTDDTASSASNRFRMPSGFDLTLAAGDCAWFNYDNISASNARWYLVGATQPDYPGTIKAFGFSTVPAGWLACDGTAVSRTTYSGLFAAIGTTWGAGDGSTTFNVPDLRSRAPIGNGQGTGLTNRVLGTSGGAETHTLTIAEMPSHTHDYEIRNNNNCPTTGGSSRWNTGTVNSTFTTLATGGGGAHANMQPWAAVKYNIKI